MPDITEQLKLAERHRKAGRLREASEVASAILRDHPQQADALNFLAVVSLETGQLQYATQFIQHAMAIRSDNAADFRVLGSILRRQGKRNEAIEAFRRCIHVAPHDPIAYFNVGNVLQDKGQFTEAVVAYKMALKFDPRHAAACHNLGQSLERLGQVGLAADWYRKAIKLKPDFVEARVDLGNALAAQGKLKLASSIYVQALRYDPKCLKAHNNLGSLLSRQGNYKAAVTSYRQALRIAPNDVRVWNNLGNMFTKLDRFEQAEKCYEKAIAIEPGYVRAYFNRGNLQLRRGQLDEAIRQYELALEIDPQYAQAHLQRAHVWLLRGDFQRGWPELQWRLKIPGGHVAMPPLPQPRWDGGPLQGKTILLYTERNIDDTLQFVRYAPMVKQRGATVVLACPPAWQPLLSSCPGIDTIVTGQDESLPEFDVHAPLMSLPGTVETTLETIPSDVPYLYAEPQRKAAWREKLADRSRLQVGVAWQSHIGNGHDLARAIPPELFSVLADAPSVQLVCLQQGPGAKRLASLRQRFAMTELDIDAGEEGTELVEMAAVIANLDLVICPDVAVAHLAGALGVAVWVALSCRPNWRWQLERDDCPWYPTMRLFRQSPSGNWDDVFQKLASALRQRAASHNAQASSEDEP